VIDSALPLKLSVAEKQDQIDVTWDRNAAAVTQANRGVLSISDGSNRRDLELTGAQLRNGRVLYSRLSADVGIRLEVFQEGKESVSESIRIVSPESVNRIAAPSPPRPERNRVAGTPAPAAPLSRALPLPVRSAPKTAPPPRAVVRPVDAVKPPEPQPEVELQRPARRR